MNEDKYRRFCADLEGLVMKHTGDLTPAMVAGFLLGCGADLLADYAPSDKAYEDCIFGWYGLHKKRKRRDGEHKE